MKGFAKAVLLATALTMTAGLAADGAQAAEDWTKGFMIRARGLAILPDESSDIDPIGGSIEIDDAVVPELDFSYFFTENIALELIAATAPHDVKAKNTALGDLKLGDFWILPPTLLAQFHLPLGNGVKPYVGAGINYTFVYGEDAAGGAITDLEIDNGLGWALQIGVDYMIDDHWLINADLKRLWLNVDAKVNGGAVEADIDVDPWIVGVGIGYRF